MIKKTIKYFLYFLILITIGVFYLSYYGIETIRFNQIIKDKISETNNKIDIELNKVKIILNLSNFTIGIKIKNPNIKTIHFVAPQVWVWREHRLKKLKSFLDHVLLLFPFEKKYFDKENIQSTFTGHPLLENDEKSKIDISQIIKDHKKIISIFPGSRQSEIDVLLPILTDFIKMMNEKYKDVFYVFHSTSEFN